MKGLLREKNNSIEKSLKNRKMRKKLGQKKKIVMITIKD